MYCMEINDYLSLEKKNYIKTKKWYHQRFDACPHFLIPIAYGEVRKERRKPEGTIATCRCTIIQDGKSDWYMLEEDNKQATKVFVERAEQGDIRFTERMMKEWKEHEQMAYGICNDIDKLDLNTLNDEELLELHTKAMDAYITRYTSSSIIDGFALGGDRIIADKIHNHLKSIGRDHEYDKLFSVLTAPVHLSFTNEAELSLLAIAAEIKKYPTILKLFQTNNAKDIVKVLDVEVPRIKEKLLEHQKRYFWVRNNYNDAFILTEEHFINEIKKIFADGIDVEHELRYISEHPENNKQTKEKLIQELKLPVDIQALIKYSEDFTHWQDERKKFTFHTTHYLTVLLKEIGRRQLFNLEELKQLLPDEVEKVFKGDISRNDLQKRIKGCFVIFDEQQGFVTTEQDIISDLYNYFESMDLPEGKIEKIKGLCGSVGKARGPVKIIKSAREIEKIEKGDILVAVMTRPDYVVGMKRSAAIVTNEGGITCHAAIVARELRIPCVIATKFATKVLKDGDLVEVDADNGELRIIEDQIDKRVL